MWVNWKHLTLLVKTQKLPLGQIFIEKRTLALNIDEKQGSTNINSFLPRWFSYNIYYLGVYIFKSELRKHPNTTVGLYRYTSWSWCDDQNQNVRQMAICCETQVFHKPLQSVPLGLYTRMQSYDSKDKAELSSKRTSFMYSPAIVCLQL